MATIRDEALCIRHWDWSETSQTVSLFTREHGLIRGLAKGARREKSPFSGGLELLTRAEVVAIVRSSGAMATITAWDLLETFPAARKSLAAFHVGAYLIDLLHHTVTDEDPHPALYDGVLGALRDLARSPEWALLRGQWEVLLETGHRPEFEVDLESGSPVEPSPRMSFSPRLGGLVAPGAAGETWGVRPETVHLLQTLSRGEASQAGADSASVSRGARLLATYLRYLLDKELPTVSSLFGNDGALR